MLQKKKQWKKSLTCLSTASCRSWTSPIADRCWRTCSNPPSLKTCTPSIKMKVFQTFFRKNVTLCPLKSSASATQLPTRNWNGIKILKKKNMLWSPIQGRRMGRGKSPRWSSQRSRSNRQLGRIFLNGGGDNLGIVKHFVHHHFLPPNDRSMITINPQWWWSQSQFFISMCNYLISSPHSSAAGKR